MVLIELKNKIGDYKFAIKAFLIFGAPALYSSYFTIYLSRLGISKEEITSFSTLSMWICILSPLFWGGIRDYFKVWKPLFIFLEVISAVSAPFLWSWDGESLFSLYTRFIILEFFFRPLVPLLEAYILEFIASQKSPIHDYPWYRRCGSIGYSGMVGLSTWLFRPDNNNINLQPSHTSLSPIFFILSIMFLISAVFTVFLPNTCPDEIKPEIIPEKPEKITNKSTNSNNNNNSILLFTQPFLILCFFSTFIRAYGSIVIDIYLPIYLDSINISDDNKGLFIVVAVVSEILAFSNCDKMIRWFGPQNLIILGSVILSFRLLILSLIPSLFIILGIFYFHI